MVKALLSRWKFLERELETFTDTLRPWHLVTYYKNQRFRCKLDIPEILQKRAVYRKRKGENEESIPVKQIHQVWGVPNFLPYFEEGEDNQSMNHHSEVLKSQSRLSEEKGIRIPSEFWWKKLFQTGAKYLSMNINISGKSLRNIHCCVAKVRLVLIFYLHCLMHCNILNHIISSGFL